MGTARTVRIGTCAFQVYTRRPVRTHHRESTCARATAFIGEDLPVTDDRGQPIERSGESEDEAFRAMCGYLEQRYGPSPPA